MRKIVPHSEVPGSAREVPAHQCQWFELSLWPVWKRILLIAETIRSYECAHGLETLRMQVFIIKSLQQRDFILQLENFQVLFKLLPEPEQLSEPRKKITSRSLYNAIVKVMMRYNTMFGNVSSHCSSAAIKCKNPSLILMFGGFFLLGFAQSHQLQSSGFQLSESAA